MLLNCLCACGKYLLLKLEAKQCRSVCDSFKVTSLQMLYRIHYKLSTPAAQSRRSNCQDLKIYKASTLEKSPSILLVGAPQPVRNWETQVCKLVTVLACFKNVSIVCQRTLFYFISSQNDDSSSQR